mmetsp:Transcript_6517/g.13913  ORF Transcript_6517/g.13913 Transcript_6517/m.13913 type:complete len:305 (-) Transcript_6517:370-1284(-)
MEKKVKCNPRTSSIFREFSACSSSPTATRTASEDPAVSTEAKARLRYSRLKVELGPAVFEDAMPLEITGGRELTKKKLRKGQTQTSETREDFGDIRVYVVSSHLKEQPSPWTALSLGTPTSARAAEAAGHRTSGQYESNSAREFVAKPEWGTSSSSEDVLPQALRQEIADFRAQLEIGDSAFGCRSRTVSEEVHGMEWSSNREGYGGGQMILANRAASNTATEGASTPVNGGTSAVSSTRGQRFSRTTERAWKPEPFESEIYEDECASGRMRDSLSRPDPRNETRRKAKREKTAFSFLVRKFKL